MPAIFHVKIEDESFDGAVNHIVEASDDDTVWHCEEAGDNFDGAIFHVKWAEDGHEEPVWRVSGISRGTVTTVGPAVSPLLLPDAIADSLAYVKAYGGTEQNGTPTPDAPMDIVSNNGVLKVNKNLFNQNDVINGYVTGVTGTKVTAHSSAKTFIIPCKPRTKYTFYFDNSMVSSSRCSISGFNKKPEIGSANIQGIYVNNEPKIHSVTFTTGANVHYLALWLVYSLSDSNMQNALKTVKVMEGTSADEIYVDGLTETINVHGKNLFDKNTMDTGHGWYLNSSNVVAEGSAFRTIVIDCKPNTKYSFWHTAGIGQAGAFVMDTNTIQAGDAGTLMTQSFSSKVNANTVITTYTTPANAKKLYIVAGHTSNGRSIDDQLADLMVVEGTVATATDYEPYFNGGTATAEMLLKVGDYQDEQEILSGNITRNVGVKVLTGEENWNLAGSGDALRVDIRTDIGLPPTQDLTSPMICTHYPFDAYFSGGGSTQPGTFNAWSGPEGCFLRFSIVGMGITTVAQWKSWLATQYAAGTPVIVVYPLATETTESVAGQTLQVTQGDNTLEITQASIDGLELEAKYMKGVVASVQEVEPQGLDNNVSVSLS